MGAYTLGMWMWASEPVEAQLPTLGNGTKTFESRAMLGTEPVFFALPVDIKQRPVRVWVSLAPETSKNKAAILYYDGLVLADGERPLDQAPVYNDPDGKSGQWGGKPFTNMIQNASAEHPGPRFRAWVDRIAGRYLPDNTLPSIVLAYLLDWKGVAWHYRLVGVMLFETFWARFGWGHVLILGKHTYLGLGVFSLLAVLGTFMWLAKRLRRGGQRPLGQLLPWEACFLLLFVLATVWIAALVRGVNYLPILKIYLPVARYAYPAIIPSVLIIALGWQTILTSLFGGVEGWLKRPAILATLVYVVLFLVLDIVSLVSIVSYYSAI